MKMLKISRFRPQGSVMLMAMFFIAVFGTLVVSVMSLAMSNTQLGAGHERSVRAFAAAESGVQFLRMKLDDLMASITYNPKINAGSIDATMATALWKGGTVEGTSFAGLAANITTQLNLNKSTLFVSGRSVTNSNGTVTIPPVAFGGSADQGQFMLALVQDATDPRLINAYSVGKFNNITRTVQFGFKLEKIFKYSVYSQSCIQLGKNVVVEGDMMSLRDPNDSRINTSNPEIWCVTDFGFLNNTLGNPTSGTLKNFRDMLAELDNPATAGAGTAFRNRIYDNRLDVRTAAAKTYFAGRGYTDISGDGYIDEYDLFLSSYGATTSNPQVNYSQFSSTYFTGGALDNQFFDLVDQLSPPLETGLVQRAGYDDNVINSSDRYAKVKGSISMRVQLSNYGANTSTSILRKMIQGPIIPADPTVAPVTFGMLPDDMPNVLPSDFVPTADAYKTAQGSLASATSSPVALAPLDANGNPTVVVQNITLSQAMATGNQLTDADLQALYDQSVATARYSGVVGQSRATTDPEWPYVSVANFKSAYRNGQTLQNNGKNYTTPQYTVTESVPYGVQSGWQATYSRPVFKNVTFKNVKIPAGLNAVFINCKFQDITYVDLVTNVTKNGSTTTDRNDGMDWSKRMKSGYTFDANKPLTADTSQGYVDGNNTRFMDCTFEGVLVAATTSAYTHFSNEFQINGMAIFNNTFDPKCTILAANTNIDLGSYTRPASQDSVLKGVVVAGNIDIRAKATVDGSIIVPGDGSGNTTLGWFGMTDSAESDGAMPAGGYGRLYIRYNPTRSLPNGIRLQPSLTNISSSYRQIGTPSWITWPS